METEPRTSPFLLPTGIDFKERDGNVGIASDGSDREGNKLRVRIFLGSFPAATGNVYQAVGIGLHRAGLCKHEYFGAEHLLSGIASCGPGVGAELLKKARIHSRELITAVDKLAVPGEFVTPVVLATPRAKAIFTAASVLGRENGRDRATTGDLLAAIWKEGESPAAAILKELDVSGLLGEVLSDLSNFVEE